MASSNNIKEIVNTNKINKFCILGLILMTPGIYMLHQKIFILILELQGKILIAEPLKITCISNMIIDAIHAVIFGPILEEVLFRMCPTAFYSTKRGKLLGVIFAALLFGWVHSGTWHRVECMILGIILGIIFVFTGKIIYTMVIHGTTNLMITGLAIAKLKGCSAIAFRQIFLECNWTLN